MLKTTRQYFVPLAKSPSAVIEVSGDKMLVVALSFVKIADLGTRLAVSHKFYLCHIIFAIHSSQIYTCLHTTLILAYIRKNLHIEVNLHYYCGKVQWTHMDVSLHLFKSNVHQTSTKIQNKMRQPNITSKKSLILLILSTYSMIFIWAGSWGLLLEFSWVFPSWFHNIKHRPMRFQNRKN